MDKIQHGHLRINVPVIKLSYYTNENLPLKSGHNSQDGYLLPKGDHITGVSLYVHTLCVSTSLHCMISSYAHVHAFVTA